MTSHHISRLIVLPAFGVAFATPALAADAQRCAKYANLAMKDFHYADGRCPVQRDATWQPDYSYHYNRCLTARDSDLASEAELRRQTLIKCGLINEMTPR